MNLLNDIATLPPQEQATVISRLVAQHAKITNADAQQAEALKQGIQKMLYERTLQRINAGMPIVGSSTTPTQHAPGSAASTGPNMPMYPQQGQPVLYPQFPGYPQGQAPMLMPMGGQMVPGQPGYPPSSAPYAGGPVRQPQMYPMQQAVYPPGASGYPMQYHPQYAARPQMPPMQRQRQPPSYSQAASRTANVYIPDEPKERPKRAATKNVKYTFEEDEADEEEDEEEEEEEEKEAEEASKTPVSSKATTASTGKKPKAKKAKKEEQETIDEEELDQMDGDFDQEGPSIEKILSYRRTLDARGDEFLIKYRGKSYLHTEWIPRSELISEPGGSTRVKRFLGKPLSQHHFSPQHVFDPRFTQVDKIIGEYKDDKGGLFYLVKWCAQTYETVTWESKGDILNRTAPPSSPAKPFWDEEEDEGEMVGGESSFKTSGQQKLAEFQDRKIPPIQTSFVRPSVNAWTALEESPKYKDGHELRKYQLEGLNWLTFCWLKHQSCIIADEMGLGKTIQTVSFLNLISTKFKAPGPFLVVAPLSTLPHWEREFAGWTNLRVLTYHGSQPSREVMYEYEFFYLDSKGQPIQGVYKFDVLITTYEMANMGIAHLRGIPWKVGIFDEAHRLKNVASKSSENLKMYHIEHKILATGTPIQNSLDELFALLNFMEPNRFPDAEQFHFHFGNLKRSEDVVRLQELLRPIMLRRLKEDVEKTIPVKEETIIEVELTAVQKRLYKAILEKNLGFLMKGASGTNVSNLMNTMMELRKCCIHPYLIKGSEEAILADYQPTSVDDQYNCMISACGKLVLLDKLLKRLFENNHKVLIFSQMTKCLDLLEDYLKYRHYPHERIDGTIRGDLRQAAIDRFNEPTSNSFIFLLCTRAGGVGINLTSADTVVIFDSDWNPQNDLQAQARCHRIGQTKSVKVYRLITRGTYEREMFDRAGLKLGLDRAVLQHMGPAATSTGELSHPSPTGLDKREVEMLLKKGAYGLVMENDEDSLKFCEEDIDQILARRTVVVKHDNATGEGQSSGPSIFSKASFTASTEDDSVDMDDPNFWENWAKRLNTDSSTLQQSISTDEPRMKRHFKRLRAFDAWNSTLTDEINALKSATDEIPATTATASLGLWNAEERSSFLNSLLLFGANSSKVQQSSNDRSSIEIYSCIKAFVRYCIDCISVQDSDTKFKQDIEKTLLGAIATITDSNPNVRSDEDAQQQQQQESIPAELDKASFAKDEIPFPNASKVQCLQFISFLKRSSPHVKEFVQKNAYECLMRLLLLEFFRQVCEYYGVSQERSNLVSLPLVGGTLGFEATWSKQDDVKLLLSIQQNGFCQETFSQLEFSVPATVEEVMGRFKKVIISLEKRSQTESRLQIEALKDSSIKRRRPDHGLLGVDENVESVVVRSRNKRSPVTNLDVQQWNQDTPVTRSFLVIALQWGLPSVDENVTPYEQEGARDWSEFRSKSTELAQLTDNELELLGQSLVSHIHSQADGRTRRGRVPKGVQREERELDDSNPTITLADICFPISLIFAKKLIKVIDLFDTIRLEILPKASLLAEGQERKIRKAQGIPKWWDASVHDSEFVLGLEKHGISPEGLKTLFMEDEEFSFHSKRLSEPLDQGTVFKRIESISESIVRYLSMQQKALATRPSPKQHRSHLRRTNWADDEGEDAFSGPSSELSWDESLGHDEGRHRKLRNQPELLPIEEASLDDLDDPLVAPSADQTLEMLAHSLPIRIREYSHNDHIELILI